MVPVARLNTAEALATYCSECGAPPGQPCLYILTSNLAHPHSHSPYVLALRDQIGRPTRRLHNTRYHHPARRLHDWLAEHAHILWGENR